MPVNLQSLLYAHRKTKKLIMSSETILPYLPQFYFVFGSDAEQPGRRLLLTMAVAEQKKQALYEQALLIEKNRTSPLLPCDSTMSLIICTMALSYDLFLQIQATATPLQSLTSRNAIPDGAEERILMQHKNAHSLISTLKTFTPSARFTYVQYFNRDWIESHIQSSVDLLCLLQALFPIEMFFLVNQLDESYFIHLIKTHHNPVELLPYEMYHNLDMDILNKLGSTFLKKTLLTFQEPGQLIFFLLNRSRRSQEVLFNLLGHDWLQVHLHQNHLMGIKSSSDVKHLLSLLGTRWLQTEMHNFDGMNAVFSTVDSNTRLYLLTRLGQSWLRGQIVFSTQFVYFMSTLFRDQLTEVIPFMGAHWIREKTTSVQVLVNVLESLKYPRNMSTLLNAIAVPQEILAVIFTRTQSSRLHRLIVERLGGRPWLYNIFIKNVPVFHTFHPKTQESILLLLAQQGIRDIIRQNSQHLNVVRHINPCFQASIFIALGVDWFRDAIMHDLPDLSIMSYVDRSAQRTILQRLGGNSLSMRINISTLIKLFDQILQGGNSKNDFINCLGETGLALSITTVSEFGNLFKVLPNNGVGNHLLNTLSTAKLKELNANCESLLLFMRHLRTDLQCTEVFNRLGTSYIQSIFTNHKESLCRFLNLFSDERQKVIIGTFDSEWLQAIQESAEPMIASWSTALNDTANAKKNVFFQEIERGYSKSPKQLIGRYFYNHSSTKRQFFSSSLSSVETVIIKNTLQQLDDNTDAEKSLETLRVNLRNQSACQPSIALLLLQATLSKLAEAAVASKYTENDEETARLIPSIR